MGEQKGFEFHKDPYGFGGLSDEEANALSASIGEKENGGEPLTDKDKAYKKWISREEEEKRRHEH